MLDPRVRASYTGVGILEQYDNEIHESNVTASATATVADLSYQGSLDLVPAAYPLFTDFAVWFYAPDLFTGPLGPPVSYPTDGLADGTQYYDQQSAYAGQLFTSAMLTHLAQDFGAYGFVNQGGMSTITADSLIQQIAEYFGFDPETGKDIG